MGTVWLLLMAVGSVVALLTGQVEPMMAEVLSGIDAAVRLSLGLLGLFALWVGIERLAERSGLTEKLAPLLSWLFPELRGKKEALGPATASVMSNILGLSSSTPLGLRAMARIDESFGSRPEGRRAMARLVIVNAAGFCLFPAGVIALRAAQGSLAPAVVAGPSAVAGLAATVAGLLTYRVISRRGDA